jgi:large subunit ribosomal protein L17e
MVKYARQDPLCDDWNKAVRAKCKDSRVHFKNTRETANAIKNMPLTRAKQYLDNVLKKKEVVPFRVHTGGVGRTKQGKNMCKKKKRGGRTCSQGRWPAKSCRVLRDLLRTAESNADTKGLSTDKLYISHIAVQRAPKMRRRTYRAHGRINPFMASPCHIELILEEEGEEKATDE